MLSLHHMWVSMAAAASAALTTNKESGAWSRRMNSLHNLTNLQQHSTFNLTNKRKMPCHNKNKLS